MDLTPRQIVIIKAIVEEFTNTGEPVGSQTLDEKYHLGVSSATIRNEMVELFSKGYLNKPHTSAGRVPTAKAIKFYVQELLKERDLSVAEEVAVKERVWDHRFEPESLLREATRVLAERTRSLSVAALQNGEVFHAGYANLLNSTEFYDMELFRKILCMIDEQQQILDMFGRASGNAPIHLLIGPELGERYFEPVSCVFADIQVGPERGSLGIIGPHRQQYASNIPMVRYIANLINQFAPVV